MVRVLEKADLGEIKGLLEKGIYEDYTLERILREAPDFHYYLEEDGEPKACVSIWIHTDMMDEKGIRAGAIGHFEATHQEAAEEVLAAACEKLQEEGDAYVIGTIDGSTWNSYRLVTHSDGSMPFLMEPKYKEGYSKWLEGVGFKPTYLYFSTKERIAYCESRSQETNNEEITIHKTNLEKLEEVLDTIYEISIECFQKNLFYKPIQRENFKAMYRAYQQFLVEDLILLAKKGEKVVGFIFAIPNYLDQTKQSVIIKTIAVLPKYRQEGVGKKLYQTVRDNALARGFTEGITALIYKENNSQKLCDGAKVMREYTLFRKELNHEPS